MPESSSTTAAPPKDQSAQKVKAYVPGPAIPATPPAPVAEFDPVPEPPVTHDLRTVKREEEQAAALQPLDINAPDPLRALTETISIPIQEHERLKTMADFQVLAADFAESDLPADQAAKIVDVFRTALMGMPAATVEVHREVAAVRESSDVPKAAPKKSRFSTWLFLIIGVLTAGGIFAVGFVKGNDAGRATARAQTTSAQMNRRTFFPALQHFNQAFYQYCGTTERELRWITSEPMNPYIWSLIGQMTTARRRVVVVLVGNVNNLDSVKELARANGAELWHSPLQIEHCNVVQIDSHIQIDGSNDTALHGTTDPKDVALWNRDSGRPIFEVANRLVAP